ncbi:MAG TPA: hypothetical protein DCL54_17365 [Alphaproteobacteria bacterium]|nr:hypothetical protein [Alphaproteobacteria bacterium]HAJ48347.1 hypothetical protein [Alphaproteobacteria bacterium]
MGDATTFTLLLDEGVPKSLAEPFRARRHFVIAHADVLSPGASDALVTATAINNNAILVAVDRDMRRLAKRWGNSLSGRKYKRLSLISFRCKPAMAMAPAASNSPDYDVLLDGTP